MTTSHWFKARLRELDAGECRELLLNHTVGRIVFDDADGPNAFPVNYVVAGDDIVVATTPDGVIARHATNHRVALEVDDIDPANESGWSVVLRGVAEPRVGTPLDSDDEPYPWAEGTRDFMIRIRPVAVSGRRLIPT